VFDGFDEMCRRLKEKNENEIKINKIEIKIGTILKIKDNREKNNFGVSEFLVTFVDDDSFIVQGEGVTWWWHKKMLTPFIGNATILEIMNNIE